MHHPSPSLPLTPSPWRDALVLLAACALLWVGCGGWDLWGPDETRYVQIARELRASRQWLLLTENGVPYDQKPPLPFWLLAGGLALAGGEVRSWAVRLPSVLMAALLVVLTYDLGRRRLGRPVGLAAGWMALTMPMLLAEAPSARLDVPMAFWTTLALWAWLAHAPGEPLPAWRAALHGLGVVGAFFVKGPVAPVLVWGIVAFEAWRARSGRPLAELRLGWNALALAVLAWAWLRAQQALAPAGFVREQIAEATFQRIFNPDLHHKPVWFYLGVVFGDGFAPWSFLAAWGLWALVRRQPAVPQTDRLAVRPLAVWALGMSAFFSLLPGKREQYLLPSLPAWALLAAWWTERTLADRPAAAWMRWALASLAALAAAGFAAMGALIALRHDALAALHVAAAPWRGAVGLAAAVLLGAVAWGSSRTRRVQDLVRATVWGLGVGALAAYGAVLPALDARKSTRAICEAADAARTAAGASDEPVGAMGKTYRPQYQVYGSYRMVELPDKPEKLEAWRRAQPLPRVLMGEPQNFADTAPVLEPLGYRKIFDAGPALDGIQIWAR